MAKPYDWRNDWDWTDPDDGPASWDEYENVQEIMLDQGIPMGEQVKKIQASSNWHQTLILQLELKIL